MGKNTNSEKQLTPPSESQFRITKGKIKEMYKDDASVRRNVNKNIGMSSSIKNLTPDSLATYYYNLSVDLDNQRKYSKEAYTYYPVYSGLIDYLSNMYCWRYTYIPRLVKEKASKMDYAEMYALMGEIVEGLSVETTFPMILTDLFTYGVVYLITTKNTSSKTIATLKLPYKYCRFSAVSQFGTIIYQFDFSYFDGLGLSQDELNLIFEYYPKEMRTMYNAYLADKNNLRWQTLDPKYAGAVALNEYGFPTKLHMLFSLMQYNQYLDNELERNDQQLDKIVTHKMPTWEDKLVVSIEEMTELHQSMARIIAKNKHIRLLTSFGDLDVKSIGEDQSKENKTLENAYNAIYDNVGENHSLFNGADGNAQKYALLRDKSTVWKHVQELVSFYNIVINNSFNFKGYQCDFSILPITIYDESDMILQYKEGATLGVNKLEYVVASGVKQVNLASKFELEDFLKLDQLKPLSTSYTQNDNSKKDDGSDEESDTKSDKTDETADPKSNSSAEKEDDKANKTEQQEVDSNE